MTGASLLYRTVWAHVRQNHVLGMSGHCAHVTIYGNIGKLLMRDAHTVERSDKTLQYYLVL